MRLSFSPLGVLVLGALGLAGCRDNSLTEPTSAALSRPATPELAATGDSWLTLANMPANRTDLAAATVTNGAGESIVYAIGGLNPNRVPLTKVTAYNVVTNTWTFRRPLPVPLAGTNGAGVINGKIYVSGGYSDYGGNFPRPALYVYDPAANTWTRKADIPTVVRAGGDRQYAAGNGVSGVIDGKLYVVSGCFPANEPWGYYESCNPLFFRYNPAADGWVRLQSPFQVPAAGPTIGGVIAGKFYVMAGSPYSQDALFAVYDPTTKQWTPRNAPALARPGAASAILGGKLYLVGGRRYNGATDTMDTLDVTVLYNPATDTWARRTSMPSPRTGIAASTISLDGKPRIEVVGGIAPGNNIQYVP